MKLMTDLCRLMFPPGQAPEVRSPASTTAQWGVFDDELFASYTRQYARQYMGLYAPFQQLSPQYMASTSGWTRRAPTATTNDTARAIEVMQQWREWHRAR